MNVNKRDMFFYNSPRFLRCERWFIVLGYWGNRTDLIVYTYIRLINFKHNNMIHNVPVFLILIF